MDFDDFNADSPAPEANSNFIEFGLRLLFSILILGFFFVLFICLEIMPPNTTTIFSFLKIMSYSLVTLSTETRLN